MTRFACLHSTEASLVLECRDGAPPLWRHLGARVDPAGLFALADVRGPASFSLDRDEPLSTAPPAGLGWFGPAALTARRDRELLVAVFDEVEVAADDSTIRIALHDRVAGLTLDQTVSVDPGGAFAFGATVTNWETAPVTIDWLASVLLPIAANETSLISWRGRHNAELVELREPMPQHIWLREGRRGIPGHGGPPAVIVGDEGAGWHFGLTHALQLAWSGDSRIAIERDDEGAWVLTAGAALQPGEIVLASGESWLAPPAILGLSIAGRNGATAQQYAAVRGSMQWPDGSMRPRPVHLNSWEACYFNHDAARMGELVETAAVLGVERFVLDDGWFRGRRDDTAGLGDWTADPEKYPAGLGELAAKIVTSGMEFGLWVEPEMVNPDSDLYRAHPDWCLALDGRSRPTARNQLVLDMARTAVREYLFDTLDTLLRQLPIAYLKWDHNRDLAPAGGARQVLGTYDLLARLRAAHPSVEIESCAGGGGRCDVGVAAFVHRFWASDNIDAVSRVAIQRGFLAFLPPEVMGAHVAASPAHATGRSQSLAFRAAVALPGHFGVELDPRLLSDDERHELREWIAFYKQWRGVLHNAQVWLGEGADGLIWQAQGTRDEFLLFVIRSAPAEDRRPQPLPLPFLAGDASYAVSLLRIASGPDRHPAAQPALFEGMGEAAQTCSGSWLAHAGLPLPALKAESVAIFHGKRAA